MGPYQPRTYRQRICAEGLKAFRVVVAETDLHIQAPDVAPAASGDAGHALEAVALAAAREARENIEAEIALRPEFRHSRTPLPQRKGAPEIARAMCRAGMRAGVGPMAAVAGAVAEFVARRLLREVPEAIVENGGDIFLSTSQARTVAVFAGESPLSYKVAMRIPAGECIGICTSAGTVGHSDSEGQADAAVIVADDAALADALATALGNRVRVADDIEGAIDWASGVQGVRQALVILGANMGVWGEFELERADPAGRPKQSTTRGSHHGEDLR